ncbi:MAG: hypothetical protein KUG77_12405 [Nannocystaceae bacterium]|nr:hypothetical protein [Nannocystaceae bacterium]
MTPWPGGAPPTDSQLGELVDDALGLHSVERFEEFREAKEKGEDSGHSTVFQEDIDAGRFDAAELFALGDAVFGHEFRAADGYADVQAVVSGRRVHNGARGALDTFSCAGCHSVGGPNGAGAATQNAYLFGDGVRQSSTLIRNSPAVLGVGMVQALAREMSLELQRTRDAAIDQAKSTGRAVSVQLETKSVDFGILTARANGSIDASELAGIDPDLVVKPFGWKGQFPNLRRTIEDAARIHFGIQSGPMEQRHRDEPMPELLGDGPDWWDPDADGVQRELQEGSLTATAIYLATLEVPTIVPPSSAALRDRWAHGDALFDEIGCADCHTRSLGLISTLWEEAPDTTGAEPFVVALFQDGEEPKGTPRVKLFSDLKRHDMGQELADPHTHTDHPHIPAQTWLTRPLWGLAESPPYLHDGRAATIPDAITAHGGEAQDSANAFVALSLSDQSDLHVFLLSLSRTPKLRAPL